MKRILIVEDNDDYRALLKGQLSKSGYLVDDAESPVKGLEYIALTKYDLVISDLNLPVMSGVTFVDSVKNISPNTATIILTGHPDEGSELQSIENNVDLYIEKSKPFSVLLKYIDKLIIDYRNQKSTSPILTSKSENIVIYQDKHRVEKDSKMVELTPKEYEILRLFLMNKNVVITRDEFVEKVWGELDYYVDARLVDTHVKNLRDKLKTFSIMTVRGYGYRWNELD